MISKILHVLNPYLIFPYTYNLLCKRYIMLRNTFYICYVSFLYENSPKKKLIKIKKMGKKFCDQNKDHMIKIKVT